MEKIKEGALYKSIEIEGVRFDIYYGYECEGERARGWEPEPVYPNFLTNPQYTQEGKPFVLIHDEICANYQPISKTTECICCSNCKHFSRLEEVIGVCNAKSNKEKEL